AHDLERGLREGLQGPHEPDVGAGLGTLAQGRLEALDPLAGRAHCGQVKIVWRTGSALRWPARHPSGAERLRQPDEILEYCRVVLPRCPELLWRGPSV